MKKSYASASLAASILTIVFAALLIVRVAATDAQTRIEQFSDNEYEYSFQYPATWAIRKLPEGAANEEFRVILRGPNGSSFTVIVEKADKNNTKEEFYANPKRKESVEAMMVETIEQIYKSISRNIKATQMTIGERRDLSTAAAVKFYVATRHTAPDGKSIVVAGIHAFPFSKDYAINFLMTAFLEKTADADLDALMFVFNSFHLNGETAMMKIPSGAPALETIEPKR